MTARAGVALVSEMEAKKLPPFEQFVAFRWFGGVLEFTPDGEQVYFVSDISGQFNIWRVFVEGVGRRS